MSRRFARIAVVAVLLAAGGAAADSLPAGAPSLGGAVDKTLVLDEALLRSLPRQEIDISFETGKGPERGHYAGVALLDLVNAAGLADKAGKNPALRHIVLITGRDGYQAAIALGEIDPHYEGKAVLVAYEGGDPPASFADLRLVVPGDKHGGRSVRDVARIDVR